MHGFDVELYFYKSLERTRTLLGKTITANVKDATAELRELAMDMLGLNAPNRAFAMAA